MTTTLLNRCWGLRRGKKRVFVTIVAMVIIISFYFMYVQNSHLPDGRKTMLIDDAFFRDIAQDMDAPPHVKQQLGQACVHPSLKLNPPELAKFFYKVPKVTCNPEKDWVRVENGTFYIADSAVTSHGHVTCDYVPLVRIADDFTVKDGARIRAMKNGSKINADFFKASCFATDGSKYDNLHLGIAHNPALRHSSLPLPPDDTLGMDILMFGFDSVSRMTWMRKLPKTYEYIVNELGAVVLDGYNIVGDGTPQALLPILTGKTEWELPESRRGKPGAKPVNGHPWIWKDLAKLGYVSLWGEDMPYVGTFTYRMLGFKEPPVDHYMRPFYLQMDKYYKRNRNYCLGSEPRHNLMFKYIRDLFQAYTRTPKFAFCFHAECTHENNNPLGVIDDDMRDWLRVMNEEGKLDNALLILMSDHGARFSGIRETVQGKHEERNPFFSIRPPPWFARKYPDAMTNLRTNAMRLTTPFDIHATFEDVIHFKNKKHGDIRKRGISLFQEVPLNRTCRHADIEPHWCACLNWKTVPITDKFVIEAADTFVQTINYITALYRSQCEELKVAEITRSVMFSPNENVLKFKKSADVDGRLADLTDNTKSDVIHYQTLLKTEPGNGHYEATIKYFIKSNKYHVNPREISRVNKYGSAADCVAKQHPHLRPYCYCKSQHVRTSSIR